MNVHIPKVSSQLTTYIELESVTTTHVEFESNNNNT